MSTSQGEGHGVSEDRHVAQSPVPPILQVFFSPSSTRSSEPRPSRRGSRSPITHVVMSPGLRLYLARSADTRQRSFQTNAHTAVDIAVVSQPSNSMTPTAGVHTSVVASDNVGLPARSRERKLTSDIWDDFTAIYDDAGALVQGLIDVTTIVEDLGNDDDLLSASPNFRVERNETQVEPR